MLSSILPVLISALVPVQVPDSADPIKPVLGGRDPVLLCEGRSALGSEDHVVERYGSRYLFTDEMSKARFEADPARYEIQFGGGCGRMGPLSGQGDPDRFTVHDGRIYIFSSDGCRAGFLKDPARHAQLDDPPLTESHPAAGAAERAQAKVLLARMLAAHGGAEAIAKVGAFSATRSEEVKGRDGNVQRLHCFVWSADEGYTHYTTWGSTAAWAEFVGPDTGVRTSHHAHGRQTATMHPVARRESVRRFARLPLFVLRTALAPADAVVVEDQKGVARVVMHDSGLTTELQLDPKTGALRALRYRGRFRGEPGTLVEDTLTDVHKHGALELPHGWKRTLLEGDEPAVIGEAAFDDVRIDAAIEVFPDGRRRRY